MIDALMRLVGQVQGIVFQATIQPVLYWLGLMDWAEDIFEGLEVVLLGALAITVTYVLFRPLELWRPVERWGDRRAVWTDIAYTVVHKLGIVPAIIFLLLTPIGTAIDSYLRFKGYIPPAIEQVVPVLRGWPFATFLAYIVVLDLGEYWRHRLQHGLPWWWALHSLHHDQRQMTLWSDDRNHVLDDILVAVWDATLAMMIGVTPGEFPLVIIGLRMIESLSHTNVRVGFGRIGSALLVGPQYHRLHHAIEHAAGRFERTRGCNFAIILPVWDLLFGTWRRTDGFPPTGVAALGGRTIRCGYLAHQIEGFRRLGAALGRLVGRRHPGFVAAFPAEWRAGPGQPQGRGSWPR